jgi:tetratricopeptide (TPR) repeat protein
MAANDLGVLLARGENYQDARKALARSLAICPQSAGYRNLAIVYDRLGEPRMAQVARQEAAAAQQAELARNATQGAVSGQPVQWVDPARFAQAGDAATGHPEPSRPGPTPVAVRPPPPTMPTPDAPPQKKTSIADWLPSWMSPETRK